MPDPVTGLPKRERRRAIRQKLNTPVYASFNGPQTGMVVDLSELLDLHEDGFAVQTAEPLEVNRAVALCLDLPETRSFIHGSGHVIWSDDAGRAGIRFSGLSDASRQILKQWLFANLLIGCSNYAARAEQRARRKQEQSPEPVPVSLPINGRPNHESHNVFSVSHGSGILSPVETGLAPSPAHSVPSLQVEAIRAEVAEIAGDVDAVFQLIAERALSLTGARGTALAFLTPTSPTDEKMICRAQAGDPAPPLGAPVDVKQGLSGECVRTGLLISCEDMGNDPRVDPEIGRALGIASLMAAPIVSDFRVRGLLEVFSPHPRAFTDAHATVLSRLVELIPTIAHEKPQPENAHPEETHLQMPLEPEALAGASPAPITDSAPIEPARVEPSVVEPSPTYAIRQALWDKPAEVPEPVSQPLPESTVPEEVPEQAPETASLVPRLLHRAIIGLAITAVAVAVGYVVGPIIEKRWVPSPIASQPVTSTDQRPPAKSLAELQKLADAGDAEAQWQMGLRYHNGDGVPRDDAQAVSWFLRAAEQGHVTAQATLGAYYWAGRGVPEDLSKAYFWSAIANARGDEASKIRLEVLASRMTPAQISAAREQADAWIHSYYQRAKSEAN
ncbi:MAG: GAF domain-containing protein [Terriglobales bacterium]